MPPKRMLEEPNSSPSTIENNGWTKVEKRKAKKMKKNEGKAEATPPRFFYANTAITKRKEAVGISDIRDLVLHILGDAGPQSWLKVENRISISKTVVLFIPGIIHETINLPPLPTNPTTNPHLPISVPPIPPITTQSTETPKITSLPLSTAKSISLLFDAPAFSQSGLNLSPYSFFSTATSKSSPPNPEQKHSKQPQLPFLSRIFSHACPTHAPGDATRMHSILGAFFQVPLDAKEVERRAKEKIKEIEASGKDGATQHPHQDPTTYVLNLEQMLENEYPLPSTVSPHDVSSDPEWVEVDFNTKRAETDSTKTKKAEIFALDCEMCLTDTGKELARVCVISFESEEIIYDQLVKPKGTITDYLTKWSGITPASLENITTMLPAAQQRLISIISSSFIKTGRPPILLGHSLESDLKALKLRYEHCIDTALLFSHPRGRPMKPGLAWLMKKWLNKTIQAGGEGGHDPREDAMSCVELVKRKMIEGPQWGDLGKGTEGLFERLARIRCTSEKSSVTGESKDPRKGDLKGDDSASNDKSTATEEGKLRTAIVDRGNPAAWHGSKATTSIGCKTDEEVFTEMLKVLPDHDFVFGRFTDVAEASQWMTPKSSRQAVSTTTLTTPLTPATPGITNTQSIPINTTTPTEALGALNTRLTSLHASLPSRTALLIFTGHSDPRTMTSLQARKNIFENSLKSGTKAEDLDRALWWTAKDGRDLEEAVEIAKRGLLFLCIT